MSDLFDILSLLSPSDEATTKDADLFCPRVECYQATGEQIASLLLETPNEKFFVGISKCPTKTTQIQASRRSTSTTVVDVNGNPVNVTDVHGNLVLDEKGKPKKLRTSAKKITKAIFATTDSRLSLSEKKTCVQIFNPATGEWQAAILANKAENFLTVTFEIEAVPLKSLVAGATIRDISAKVDDDSDLDDDSNSDSDSESDSESNK